MKIEQPHTNRARNDAKQLTDKVLFTCAAGKEKTVRLAPEETCRLDKRVRAGPRALEDGYLA